MSRKRFIYQKVVTGMPNVQYQWWIPQPWVSRHKRKHPYQSLFRTLFTSEIITVDKWLFQGPTHFKKRYRLIPPQQRFIGEPIVDVIVAPSSDWIPPTNLPPRRARRLSTAVLTSGGVLGNLLEEQTQAQGFYKIKLFSRSRKTDL